MSEPSSSRPKRSRRQSQREVVFPTTHRMPRSISNQRVAVVSGNHPLPERINLFENWRMLPSVEDGEFHLIQRVADNLGPPDITFCGSPKEPVVFYNIGRNNARVRAIIEASKWHHVCSVYNAKNDQQCVLSLVERWWDTTHTFHLPFVELGFTPHDFTCLTGIPFGNGMPYPNYCRENWNTLNNLKTFFPDITNSDCNTSGIKCSYLKRLLGTIQLPVCGNSSSTPTEDELEIETMWLRGWFLLVLGEIFFPNNKKWVDFGWMEALRDPSVVGTFDWGNPILCQIYCGLDSLSRGKTKSGAFFWTVLQYWYYEYIRLPAPQLKDPVSDVYPRMLRWMPQNWERPPGRVEHMLTACRRKLEEATCYSIHWAPFATSGLIGTTEDCAMSFNASHFRLLLLAFNRVAVWYLGDRMWRQLADIPCIPHPPPPSLTVNQEDALRWKVQRDVPIHGFDLRIEVDMQQWTEYWSSVSRGVVMQVRHRDINTDEVSAAASTDFRTLPRGPRVFEGPGPYPTPDLCDITQYFVDMSLGDSDPPFVVPTAAYTAPVSATQGDLYRLTQHLGESLTGAMQYIQQMHTHYGHPSGGFGFGDAGGTSYHTTGGGPSSSYQAGFDPTQDYQPYHSLGRDAEDDDEEED